jgi:hypothetical protein
MLRHPPLGRHLCHLYHSAGSDFKTNITHSRIFFRILNPCHARTNETPGKKFPHAGPSLSLRRQGRTPEKGGSNGPCDGLEEVVQGRGVTLRLLAGFGPSRSSGVCGGEEAAGFPNATYRVWGPFRAGKKSPAIGGRGQCGLERWTTGAMEYWNIGILGRARAAPPISSFHYSIVLLAGGVRLWAVL